jgi:hypothetical protein
LPISFRSPVKNEVAQPRFSRSAGTEEGIVLGSLLSWDIPHAAINTEAMLFDLGQSLSVIPMAMRSSIGRLRMSTAIA